MSPFTLIDRPERVGAMEGDVLAELSPEPQLAQGTGFESAPLGRFLSQP